MRERKIIRDESSLENLRNEFELERFLLNKNERIGRVNMCVYIYKRNSCNFVNREKNYK